MSSMNSIQENLFQLLVEFDDVCNKYDIDYILAAGAGLGAVRNHRFLPWDDDIDLYLTRENWNKLRNIVETDENALPENRSLVYKENTPYYCNPLPRYVNDATTTMYRYQALPGKACGQHLELFIFDPMPLGESEKEEFIKLTRVYAELVSPYFIVNKHTTLEDWEDHYELYKHYCDRIDEEGEDKVIGELEEKLFSYPIEESDSYCMRWGMKVYKYDKKHFDDGEYGLFEGRKFPIGFNPEGILRVAYGDNWMYVPEPDNQIVHGGIKYDDLSFHEFTDRYLKKINRESVFKKYKRNKRSVASIFADKIRINILIAREKVVVGTPHVQERLGGKEDYLESLLDSRDYLKLLDEFKIYRDLQMIADVRKFGIFVPISDRNLEILLLCYTEMGEYFTAAKYLAIRKLQDAPISDKLTQIEAEIDFLRQLSVARYDKKSEKLVQELIDKYKDVYPDLLDIYRSKLWIMDNNASDLDDFKEIDELCSKALSLYPFDGEVMAIQARAKSKLGLNDEANKLYKKSIENTRNGLIWQKVEDETGISRIEIERSLIEGV